MLYSLVDREYSEKVHQELFSPFAIHAIRSTKDGVLIDVAFLRGEFFLYLQKSIENKPLIYIGNEPHKIVDILLHGKQGDNRFGVFSAKQFGKNRVGEVVHTLKFVTPYSGRKSQNNRSHPNIMPSTDALVKISLKRMTTFQPHLFPKRQDVFRELQYLLTVEDVSLHTTRYQIDAEMAFKGVKGHMTIRYIGDIENPSYSFWLSILDFIQLAGVGQKVTLGMGKVNVLTKTQEGEGATDAKFENYIPIN